MTIPESLLAILTRYGQEHVVTFFNQLDDGSQQKLIEQLECLDFEYLDQLAKEYVTSKPVINIPSSLDAVPTFPRRPKKDQRALYTHAYRRGEELVKAGRVGAFLVAGGQGTRLGFDGPKGTFKVTPLTGKSLFQVFAEQLIAHSQEAGRIIPWYIMTSCINRVETESFFADNNYFGYPKEDIFIFEQGTMPAFDMNGKLLLAEKGSLALSPDGHGGSLAALAKSGALADMRRRGIEHLSYFQVDNPLVHCIDYLFLGLHDLNQSEMSSKTIAKAGPLEKVGNFVMLDGKVQVIEYSDLSEDLARQTNTDGSLKYNAGSIAIHILSVDFIERLTKDDRLALPWHRAEKKVPYIDAGGVLVKPEKPNAIKLEQFVFDALPFAYNAIVYETDRREEFSPVKNAEGADSPESCREHQIARASRWLSNAGVYVAPTAVVEMSPLFAAAYEQLHKRTLKLRDIPAGARYYFGPNSIEKMLSPKMDIAGQAYQEGFLTKLGTAAERMLGTEPEQAI